MAKSLVAHLTSPFNPDQFHDTYRENVERLIEEKKKGRKITAVKQPRKAPVIDLMEALQRSLKMSRPRKSNPKASDRIRVALNRNSWSSISRAESSAFCFR
jgi:DNA end-binding protein Ku